MSGFYLKCIKDVILEQESFREVETRSPGLLEASIIRIMKDFYKSKMHVWIVWMVVLVVLSNFIYFSFLI